MDILWQKCGRVQQLTIIILTHKCHLEIQFFSCFPVLLGVDFLYPNISGEMAQLQIKDQEKCVPVLQGDGKILLQTIFFDGDQLTEETVMGHLVCFQILRQWV